MSRSVVVVEEHTCSLIAKDFAALPDLVLPWHNEA